MEMPSEQVVTRMLASIGGVPLNSLRSGQITDDDWVRITGATSQLSEAKIFIDETPALTRPNCAPARGASSASMASTWSWSTTCS